MRMTVTLDEDLAERLKELARQEGRDFNEVAHEVIRRGLSVGGFLLSDIQAFRVAPKACGFRQAVDPLGLNQLSDDLEI